MQGTDAYSATAENQRWEEWHRGGRGTKRPEGKQGEERVKVLKFSLIFQNTT